MLEDLYLNEIEEVLNTVVTGNSEKQRAQETRLIELKNESFPAYIVD